MKTLYELHYTKLNGKKNVVFFSSMDRLQSALEKAKTTNPEHNMQERIFTPEQATERFENELRKLKPVTFSERMAARHMSRKSPSTARIHGYC